MNRFTRLACINYAKEKGYSWEYKHEVLTIKKENEIGIFMEFCAGDVYLIAICFLKNGKLEITEQAPVGEFTRLYYKPDNFF